MPMLHNDATVHIALDLLESLTGAHPAIENARAELMTDPRIIYDPPSDHVDQANRLEHIIAKKRLIAAAQDFPLESVPWIEDAPPEIQQGVFIWAFLAIAKAAHANAVSKGFWDEDRNFGEQIALMHSELSEALEAMRHGNPPDSHIPAFDGISAELADCVIRIMDTSARYGYPVAEALIAKMEFNASRPPKHGKAF